MQPIQTTQTLSSWERSRTAGDFLKAFLPLLGRILFRPVEFFKELADFKKGDLKKRIVSALFFAFVLGYLKLFFDFLNIYWLKAFIKDTRFASLFAVNTFISPLIFVRPLIVFAVTFILICAGVKFILGFDRSVLPALLVVCYKAAADIFYCFPLFGGILASLWSVALIVLGIRELYSTGVFRSIASSVVVPFLIFFLIILSMGTFLNRAIVALYPETQAQIVGLNEITAYANTKDIVAAIQLYKKELGFYPAALNALKKYLTGTLADEITSDNPAGGYKYYYNCPDEGHFTLEARPNKLEGSGRFLLFADESGKIRLGTAQGTEIKDIRQMEEIIVSDFQREKK